MLAMESVVGLLDPSWMTKVACIVLERHMVKANADLTIE